MKLELLPGEFSICRLPPNSPTPQSFFSLTRTQTELSVVCLIGDEAEGAKVERGWSCMRVSGVLDFSLTGILASLALPLAEAKVSIFAVSTFDTDYLLVKDLSTARQALEAAGHFFLT
jgi:uncharacterized protein